MSQPDILSVMNETDVQFRSKDGREAWVLMNGRDGYAFIATDPYNQGQPYNAVAFSASDLRWIADRIDELNGTTA